MKQLPPDTGREVAFVGRSNVGKSSVINTITGQKGLAKTSKTPGRTQLINYFQLNEDTFLVDLPGYGFAKVPKAMKDHWTKTINAYLQERSALAGLILIIDVRRGLQAEDRQIVDWCSQVNLPVHILLNKADKLSFGAAKQTLLALQRELHEQQTAQLFSVLKRTGLEETCKILDGWLFSES